MKNSNIDSLIQETLQEIQIKQFELANLKNLKSIYPDIRYYRTVFSDKKVNTDYDEIIVDDSYYSLELKAYKTVEFKYGDLVTETKVYTYPYTNRIAERYQRYDNATRSWVRKIKFTKYCKTFKTKKFDEEMLKKVREATLLFLDKYKEYTVDDTNLDPKLKKILLFR